MFLPVQSKDQLKYLLNVRMSVCLSVCLLVCAYLQTQESTDGFSWSVVFDSFTKNCPGIATFICIDNFNKQLA